MSYENPNKKLKKDHSMTLRKDSDVWLVGQPLPSIKCAALPTNRDVYRHFLYIKSQLGVPAKLEVKHASKKGCFLSKVASETLDVVKSFWVRANIPLKSESACK